MPRRNNQPSWSSVTAASSSSGHASVGVDTVAAVVAPVPAALLNLLPQIIAAGGDEKIASFTIRTGWDGTLAVTYFGKIVPLATAVERSIVILDAAMDARAVVLDVAMRARMLNAMQQEVALVTRVAFRKLKKLDFDGFHNAHFRAIYEALSSQTDSWEHGPYHDEVMLISQFCGRMANLLQPGSLPTGCPIA
ncbi:hypothetical protein ACHAXH_000717 [Discostella pseudostelligera]